MQAKERPRPKEPPLRRDAAIGRRAAEASRPLLMVDIDGVISLFGAPRRARARRRRGVLPLDRGHAPLPFVHRGRSPACARRALRARLGQRLGGAGQRTPPPPARAARAAAVPALRARASGARNAHWKLDAIEPTPARRPLAWIDDALDDACHEWAGSAPRPTLLVQTDPERGLTTRRRRSWRVGAGAGGAAARRAARRAAAGRPLAPSAAGAAAQRAPHATTAPARHRRASSAGVAACPARRVRSCATCARSRVRRAARPCALCICDGAPRRQECTRGARQRAGRRARAARRGRAERERRASRAGPRGARTALRIAELAVERVAGAVGGVGIAVPGDSRQRDARIRREAAVGRPRRGSRAP